MAFSNEEQQPALDVIEGGNRRRAKGRVSAEKQEQVCDSEAVKARLGELERAWTRSQEATADLGAVIKAVAEKAGYNAGPLRRFLNARMKDKLLDVERDNDQFTQLMLDLGEKSTRPA
jgi:hypothetical protein